MKRFLIILVFSMTFAVAVIGQTVNGSTLKGVIRDGSGAGISNASVRLFNAKQITIANTQTDAEGRYRIENVAAGSYVLSASRADFSTARREVRLLDGTGTELDLVLSIGEISEQITITAETGRAENKNQIPVQINLVTQDMIAQRTTNVLAQVAEGETGVSLQRTSPTIGSVLVRGLTEVGVYVDGIRFTNSTQRGGINTFFNLNEPTFFRSVEIQRSPNTAQFGSDGLGGNVQLISRQPEFGFDSPVWNGEAETFFGAADNSFGGNAIVGYGTKRFGITGSLVGRRVNKMRPGGGVDGHSAITRFLGLPSNIIGSDRLPDTSFTQYGGTLHSNISLSQSQSLSLRYQRSQQDGGKRYDQLLGGDGNLIAELRNLMLDFGYVRYFKQGVGFFDDLSANISYNSQREERQNQGGQGNPFANITNDRERTTTWGAAFYLDKALPRNDMLVGGDLYLDSVTAPSFSISPTTGEFNLVRPRVPNGATYKLGGVYVQNVFNAIPNRLRLSGALRYNEGRYRSRASESPFVNGSSLFPDDSGTFRDVSGRIGATLKVTRGLLAAFNFSRGFRAPNITSLGSLGLVGVGFQVSTADVAGLGATIGTTADSNAVSTGIPVAPLRSELSNNYDASIRYAGHRLDVNLSGFLIDYSDAIVRQTLILPQGAVGSQLGSQGIIAQNANGAVFVAASTAPVLVQANFNATRLYGTEFNIDYRITSDWIIGGNHSFVYALDRDSGDAPNLGGGGIPPQLANVRLRFQPANRPFWIEGYMNIAGEQDRLSTLDLSDRRTGAARTRAQIQNFFRRGACVRGLTRTGNNGLCNSADGTLISTGESLSQVQNRILPIGSIVNGVLITDDNTAVPMFSSISGYMLASIRGGYRLADNQELLFDAKNIGDKSHRLPGWGIDGPGRNIVIRYRIRF